MHSYFAILGILCAVLCAGLAFFTLLRNPRHLSNIGFTFGVANLMFIGAGCAVVLLSPTEPGFVLTGASVFFSGLAALPATWLLFSIVFARSNYKEILVRWAPALAVCAALSLFFAVKSASLFELAPGHLSLTSLGRYFNVYLIIGSVFNLVHLENTLKSSRGSNRWHVKYLLFGVGSIFAFFIYLASHSLLFSTLDFEFFPLTAAVILISTAVMSVYIVKHRLLDFDIFISRYVVYNSVTILVVGVYLLVVGLITEGIRFFEMPYAGFLSKIFVFVAVLFLMVLLFAAALRRKAQLFINRHFYKHKYEFRDKWMETVEKITPQRSVRDVSGTLMGIISETMFPSSMHLWVTDPVSKDFVHAGEAAPAGLARVSSNDPFMLAVRERLAPFSADDAKVGPGCELFQKTGSVLCSPLVAGSEVMGILLLGPDKAGARYIQDDNELLKAVCTQAAVQIKEILLLEELTVAKEMEAFSKMSSFIMHDLKNLTNSLSLVSQNAQNNMDNPEFQRDTIRTIDQTVSRMKKVIGRLSSMPRELKLKKQLLDVGELVEKTLRKLALPAEKEISLKRDVRESPPVLVDPEALEMVILNLILNAYDAIETSGEISLNVSFDNALVSLSVADTGRGMTREYVETSLFRPFKSTKKNGLGIGLFQCKSIIEAHGGSIEVDSSPGAGTSFTIKLPIHAELARS